MSWRLICRWPGFGTRWACTSAVSAVADAGLVVPSGVAVTGYDDTFVAAIRQVSLTSVNPDSSGI
jgi:DNA-binding LacI/PurR family transcriptional regulator